MPVVLDVTTDGGREQRTKWERWEGSVLMNELNSISDSDKKGISAGFKYELKEFRTAFIRLKKEPENEDALKICLLHGRNLLEFFAQDCPSHGENAWAEEIVISWKNVPEAISKDRQNPRGLWNLICSRLNHLSHSRHKEGKIRDWAPYLNSLKGQIEACYITFIDLLPEAERADWKLDSSHPTGITPMDDISPDIPIATSGV